MQHIAKVPIETIRGPGTAYYIDDWVKANNAYIRLQNPFTRLTPEERQQYEDYLRYITLIIGHIEDLNENQVLKVLIFDKSLDDSGIDNGVRKFSLAWSTDAVKHDNMENVEQSQNKDSSIQLDIERVGDSEFKVNVYMYHPDYLKSALDFMKYLLPDCNLTVNFSTGTNPAKFTIRDSKTNILSEEMFNITNSVTTKYFKKIPGDMYYRRNHRAIVFDPNDNRIATSTWHRQAVSLLNANREDLITAIRNQEGLLVSFEGIVENKKKSALHAFIIKLLEVGEDINTQIEYNIDNGSGSRNMTMKALLSEFNEG